MKPYDVYHQSKAACDREFIEKTLGFDVDPEAEPLGKRLKLNQVQIESYKAKSNGAVMSFETIEAYLQFFDDAESVAPERIKRPEGDTTLFTTAGVQRIESMQRDGVPLDRRSFIVAQPVIRSQFMDRSCNGTSSAFINMSVIDVRSTPAEFMERCSQLVQLVCAHGIEPDNLRFSIGTDDETWGERSFHNVSVTIYNGKVELGECLYIYDYPSSEDEGIGITDLGFGLERLQWGIWPERDYLPEFGPIYEQLVHVDSNRVSAIIDTVRSMALIASEGVTPANNNHGYRLRQMSKRFIARTRGLQLDVDELIRLSYESWQKCGYLPVISLDEVRRYIIAENDRNFNAMFIAKLTETNTANIYIDVNQSTEKFLRQVGFSLSAEAINIILSQIT